MAAFMADYELFQIEITRTYGKNEWRDDIRKLFRKSGVEGKSTVFLFNDSQIVRKNIFSQKKKQNKNLRCFFAFSER